MSSKAWSEAQKHLVGGVNSPVRSFKAVGGEPVFVSRGRGAYLFDASENAYLDFCLSWGALLLGHADRDTVKAVQQQAVRGLTFGACTEAETALAVEIKKAFPRLEKIRFTSSGTEAAMSAIRLARGVTKKSRLIKFHGCYHGHSDGLLVKAGSGLATFATPDSAGVPDEIAKLTTVLPYNDPAAVHEAFKKHRDIACVIVEPVAGNMGVVPAKAPFLEALRKETAAHEALLIFDEVITGFRVAYGGAQHLYGIEPDITVLGKIIGGGLPVGAFGGAARLMDHLSPTGPVYQAGTLSGNPLSMKAGLAVLSRLTPAFYKKIGDRTDHFLKESRRIFKKKNKVVTAQNVGSMFTFFFSAGSVSDFHEASMCDTKAFTEFFGKMLAEKVYFPPSQFEASFLSAAHGSKELHGALEALNKL